LLLFDECIPEEVCSAIRVLQVPSTDVRAESLVGATDEHLVGVARRLSAIFVTYDLDFTTRPIYAAMVKQGVCVVLLRRPKGADLATTAEMILRFMRQWPDDCASEAVIISCTTRGCRVRKLSDLPYAVE
jgi:predicted nuclease of predicted toxin-antitoxin system